MERYENKLHNEAIGDKKNTLKYKSEARPNFLDSKFFLEMAFWLIFK